MSSELISADKPKNLPKEPTHVRSNKVDPFTPAIFIDFHLFLDRCVRQDNHLMSLQSRLTYLLR